MATAPSAGLPPLLLPCLGLALLLCLPAVSATGLWDGTRTSSAAVHAPAQRGARHPKAGPPPPSMTLRRPHAPALNAKPGGEEAMAGWTRHRLPLPLVAPMLAFIAGAVTTFLAFARYRPAPLLGAPTAPPAPAGWAMVASADSFSGMADFVPGLVGVEISREEAYRLAEEGDRLITALSGNGEVAVRAVQISGLVAELQRMHGSGPLGTVALGQAAASALLLAAGRRDELETFQLRVRGDGPLNGVVAVADGTGRVRGYCGNEKVAGVDMATAIGKGTIEVVRSHPNPDFAGTYSGITEITRGNIPEDVANYLDQSEQVRSALAAGVCLPRAEGAGTLSAGGYLVQLLPGASEETISTVELNLAKLMVENDARGAGDLLQAGLSPARIVDELLLDLQPRLWTASSPRLWCKNCSTEAVYAVLKMLPVDDLRDILASPEELNARCEWCCRDMPLERPRVQELIDLRLTPGGG